MSTVYGRQVREGLARQCDRPLASRAAQPGAGWMVAAFGRLSFSQPGAEIGFAHMLGAQIAPASRGTDGPLYCKRY